MRHHRIPKSKRHKKVTRDAKVRDEDESDEEVKPRGRNKFKEVNVEDLMEQKVPRKAQELFNGMNKPKAKRRQRKRSEPALLSVRVTEEEGDKRGMTRNTKALPERLDQGPYESEEQFIYRLSRLSSRARAEATIEAKYDVDFCPQMMSTTNGEKKGKEGEEKGAKKRLKRKERDTKKKERKRKLVTEKGPKDDFSHLKDVVKFGEVVFSPPSLGYKTKSDREVTLKEKMKMKTKYKNRSS